MGTVLLIPGYLFIAIAVILLITTLRRVIKKEKFTARDRAVPIILIGVGFLFVIALVFHYSGEIQLSDRIQILLMFGLVAVTSFYAWSASRQADASVKMAKEMKEQRLSEARPYLLLRLDLAYDELLQWDTYQGKLAPEEFKVTIRNAGKGPAINLEASLWHSTEIYPSDTKGYLASDQEWEATISKLTVGIGEEVWLPELRNFIKQDDPGVIVVKYQDIYKRTWVSYLYLERHIEVGAFVMEDEQNIVELKNNDS